LIRLEIPYGRYLGIDISTKNIMYLQEQFPGNKHKFIVDDIETMQLHDNFDVLLSSLTFKHFFPSFKKALLNVSRHMNPNAMIFFDLPEGKLRVFHKGTYLRWYTKSEVKDILGECHLEIVAFGHVVHGSSARRLLIVAKSSRAKLSEAPTALPSYASAPFSRGENS
jgi:SAM-dependent methyltransferase